jgi:phosphatidylethanolamine/phosphatidyl-N-methylethanolamine N-methyltransferase
MEHRSGRFRFGGSPRRPEPRLGDEKRFFRSLIENPRLTGAVAPSGPHLARAMARAASGCGAGLVVELGPGTGPVTRALIEAGIARERLVLVEFDPGFCRLLSQRFAPVRVIQGDAFDLARTLAPLAGQPVAAIVSSLPLLNSPPPRRAALIEQAFDLMGPAGLFVQFTYGLRSPIPRQACVNRYSGHAGGPIWRNLPPARVWVYRADSLGFVREPVLQRLRHEADLLGERIAERTRKAEQIFDRQRAKMRHMLKDEAQRRLEASRLRRRGPRREPPPET